MVSIGPRPSSQSWRLASVSTIMPSCALRSLRDRYFGARRFWGERICTWRRIRRTLGLLKTIPSAAASVSCRCESLNPAYFPQSHLHYLPPNLRPDRIDRPRLQ
jgi:hypothetical protein